MDAFSLLFGCAGQYIFSSNGEDVVSVSWWPPPINERGGEFLVVLDLDTLPIARLCGPSMSICRHLYLRRYFLIVV